MVKKATLYKGHELTIGKFWYGGVGPGINPLQILRDECNCRNRENFKKENREN